MVTPDVIVVMKLAAPAAYLLLAVAGYRIAAQQPAIRPDAVTFGTTVVIPSGLRGDIYFLRKNTTVLPDFAALKSKGTIWTTSLNVTPRHWRNGAPGITKRFEWFAINYTGRFWINRPGPYRFSVLSDDGSILDIDDRRVIDNDCLHPPDVRGQVVNLNGGIHRLRLAWFQGPRECLALVLSVAGPDEDWRIFSTDEFRPPADPDQWSFGALTDLLARPTPESKRVRLEDMIGKHKTRKLDSEPHEFGKETNVPRHDPGAGCFAPPVHTCGA